MADLSTRLTRPMDPHQSHVDLLTGLQPSPRLADRLSWSRRFQIIFVDKRPGVRPEMPTAAHDSPELALDIKQIFVSKGLVLHDLIVELSAQSSYLETKDLQSGIREHVVVSHLSCRRHVVIHISWQGARHCRLGIVGPLILT